MEDSQVESRTWASCVHVKSLQSCPMLYAPMDCGPPCSSVGGILQAGMLEWVAWPSSMGSSQPGDQTCVSYVYLMGRWVLYHERHLGSPGDRYSVGPGTEGVEEMSSGRDPRS